MSGDAPVSRRTIALALLGLGFVAWLFVQGALAMVSDLTIPMV